METQMIKVYKLDYSLFILDLDMNVHHSGNGKEKKND